MNDPCSASCPFIRDCPSCEYQGGENPAETGESAGQAAMMSGYETAPEQCANTAEGLTARTGLESQWL